MAKLQPPVVSRKQILDDTPHGELTKDESSGLFRRVMAWERHQSRRSMPSFFGWASFARLMLVNGMTPESIGEALRLTRIEVRHLAHRT